MRACMHWISAHWQVANRLWIARGLSIQFQPPPKQSARHEPAAISRLMVKEGAAEFLVLLSFRTEDHITLTNTGAVARIAYPVLPGYAPGSLDEGPVIGNPGPIPEKS